LIVSELVVETKALHKTFRDFWGRPRTQALKKLDLEISRGELFGLLGPNGSGKSTTIKLLLGLLHPSSGEARVFGGPPGDVRLKARIGYLPEESYLYPHLSAEETLLFYGRIFSLPRAEIKRRTDHLLKLVGLEAARKRRVGEFSKGMLRRIGLAQALINDPDLLILDEPTASLDPIGAREVKDLLLDLKRRGKTVLLSSHLLADVEDVCDRVAILFEGRLEALGAVSALLADDQRTQITTGRLSPSTLEALISFLREREGPGLAVEVGVPSARLEAFFLKAVLSRREASRGDGGEP
jgi:ABC-2 type transport system ATP-binding protein